MIVILFVFAVSVSFVLGNVFHAANTERLVKDDPYEFIMWIIGAVAGCSTLYVLVRGVMSLL